MHCAVVVPGIMGSRLSLPSKNNGGMEGEEVWPPTPLETKFGYKRIVKLQNRNLRPTGLIDNVLCFSFYGTIKDQLKELGFQFNGQKDRLVDFPYDWRQDNFLTAERLASRLDQLDDEGASEISLLGHSMGGLVVRILLETGKYRARPWFSKIKLFVALATPHLGAPLALARIFGLDSTLGISAGDFAKLAANRDYPSGYQLIPAPGEPAVWNRASPDVAPLDIYDNSIAHELGMDPVLIGRAKALHDALASGKRPDHVRYFFFAGAGHSTLTRVNVVHRAGHPVDHEASVVTVTADAGDGTVPLFSALPAATQRQIVINEHSTVFKGDAFRRVFFRLMGGDAGDPTELALDGKPVPKLRLTVAGPVQRLGQPIEVTLSVEGIDDPTEPTGEGVSEIKGRFLFRTLDQSGNELPASFRPVPLAYRGPPIDRLTVRLPGMKKPGFVEVRFEGAPAAPEPVRFAVCRVR